MSDPQPVTMAEIMDQLRLLSQQEGVDGILMVDDSDQPEQLSIDKSLTENAEDDQSEPEFTIVENVTEVIDPSYARSNITNDIPETSEASEGTESIALDLGSVSETEERDTGDDDDALIKSQEAQKMWDALKAMENADSDSTIQNIQNILNSPPAQPPQIVNLIEEDLEEEEKPAEEPMDLIDDIVDEKEDRVDQVQDDIVEQAPEQEDMIELDLGETDMVEDANDNESQVDARNINDEIAGYLKQLEEINEAEPSEEFSQQQEMADVSMLSNSAPEKRQLWKDLSSMMALSSNSLTEEDEDEEEDDEEQEDEEKQEDEEEEQNEEEKEEEDEEKEEEEEKIQEELEEIKEEKEEIKEGKEELEELEEEKEEIKEEVELQIQVEEPQVALAEIMAESAALPSDYYVERMDEIHLSKSQPESLKEDGIDDVEDLIELDVGPEDEDIALDNLIDNVSTKDLYEDANDAEEQMSTPQVQVPPVSQIFIRKPMPLANLPLTPQVYSQPLPLPPASTIHHSTTPQSFNLAEKIDTQIGLVESPKVPLDIFNKNKAIDVYSYEMGMFKVNINDALKKNQTTLSRLAKRFNTALGKTVFQPTDLQGMFSTLNRLTPRQFRQLMRLDLYKDTSVVSKSSVGTQLTSNLTYVPSRFQPSHSLFRSARQPSLFGQK